MNKPTLFSIFYLLSSLLISLSGYTKILMKPYLQAVTNTSVYVMVECDSRDSVVVKFGATENLGRQSWSSEIGMTTAAPATFVHKIKLTGLLPEMKFYYVAFQGTSTMPASSFSTAVMEGTPFRFSWMADFRTNIEVHDTIAALVNEENSLFSIYGGDLCTNSTYDSWKKEFFTPHQIELISKVPFFNTPGNHEGWKENAKAFSQNPDSPSGTQDYYSFDYGDLHVVCINYMLPLNKGSEQYEFVAKDLSSTSKKWKIVVCHAPAYCKGGHGNNKQLIEMTKNIFEPIKVDAFLAGHTHFFQHNLVNKIHHLVIGSAGAPLYKPKKWRHTIAAAEDYNWAIGEVSSTRLILTIYNAKKQVLDRLDLKK